MATCCDCSSDGKQYIIQQYTECCAACICDPRDPDCFYIEGGHVGYDYTWQTGLFDGAGPYVTNAPATMLTGNDPPDVTNPGGRGCYYTGIINPSNLTVNIFPPFFSGDYVTVEGEAEDPYINNSSGSGFWQIYNKSYGYSYDRDWNEYYGGCSLETIPWFDNQLWGTGWLGDDGGAYIFSIGNCCMTGECMQELSSVLGRRCYEWGGHITPGGGRTTPTAIEDWGIMKLSISTCQLKDDLGENYSLGIYMEYTANPGAVEPVHRPAQWRMILTDGSDSAELVPFDDDSEPYPPLAFTNCDDDLANSFWTTDEWGIDNLCYLGDSCEWGGVG